MGTEIKEKPEASVASIGLVGLPKWMTDSIEAAQTSPNKTFILLAPIRAGRTLFKKTIKELGITNISFG